MGLLGEFGDMCLRAYGGLAWYQHTVVDSLTEVFWLSRLYLGLYGLFGQPMIKTGLTFLKLVYHIYQPKLVVVCFSFLCPPLAVTIDLLWLACVYKSVI
jgi:hypothetical protein